MPYIGSSRDLFDPHLNNLSKEIAHAGELNYCMTRLALGYVRFKGKKYLTFCVVIGTFVCAALEFYRRWVGPYEDEKIVENGDVSW